MMGVQKNKNLLSLVLSASTALCPTLIGRAGLFAVLAMVGFVSKT